MPKTQLRAKWVRVSKSSRCLICDKDHHCTRSADGILARCTRIKSDWISETKDGSIAWIHRLNDPLPSVIIEELPPRPKKDAAHISEVCFNRKESSLQRVNLSKKLSVSVESLEALKVGIGLDRDGTFWWSFPSRGCEGEIVGITRRYEDGSKKALAGTSNSGIFCKEYWWVGNYTAYIVEGPSDTAALIDAGLSVLGRPSNIGGMAALVAYLRRRDPKRIVVLGENDAKPERRGSVEQCPKTCSGCGFCHPGLFGCMVTANRLAKALNRQVETRMPPPEFKDARQWWIGNKLKGLQ